MSAGVPSNELTGVCEPAANTPGLCKNSACISHWPISTVLRKSLKGNKIDTREADSLPKMETFAPHN